MKFINAGFWKADWFLSLVVVVLIAIFSRASDLIPSLERKAYDLLVQADSGLASITGSPEAPARVGVSVVDIGAANTHRAVEPRLCRISRHALHCRR